MKDFHMARAALLCIALFPGVAAHAQQQIAQPAPLEAAAETDPAEEQIALNERLPKQALTPQILYQLLLAEIAGQRGNFDFSVQAYFDLAKSTRDPRVARRALEIALFARRNDIALEAARLWMEIDPESAQARQMLTGILASGSNLDELQPHLAKLLSQEGDKIGDGLLRLNRLLARYSDKAAVARLVDQLTEPYLRLPEAHIARAQAAQAAGNMERARQAADAALTLRPDSGQAVIYLAQLQQLKSGEQALGTLQRFLAAYPQASEVRQHYARLLVTEKKFPEARAEFDRLLTDFSGGVAARYAAGVLSMQIKDFATAEIHFRKLIEADHPESSTLRLYLGQIAEEDKRYEEALSWYASIPEGERHLTAQTRYATLLSKQGKLGEARAHLQKTPVAQEGERTQLLLVEAQLLHDAGKTGEGFELLQSGLAAQPDHPDLLYDAALLAEKTGNFAVLETNLRRLIKLKPDHAHALNALGYSLADRNMRLEEAQQLISRALQLLPDDASIIDSMGWLLYRKGDLKGAFDLLQRALALRQDPEIAAHLGEVQWMLGRRDEAARTWREAAKAHPGSPELLNAIKKFAQ